MKRRLIRTLALMSVLSAVLPFQVVPTEGGTSNPFLMRILDEHGQGIPKIRVVSDNGIVCRTRADGSVHWTERSVMNRDVRFRLDGPNGRRDVTLHPTAGGWADVSLEK
jgi:hypothetical protein